MFATINQEVFIYWICHDYFIDQASFLYAQIDLFLY